MLDANSREKIELKYWTNRNHVIRKDQRTNETE